SLFLTAVSLAPLPFLSGHTGLSWSVLFSRAGLPWVDLLFLLALLACGSGLTRPPLFCLISNLSPASEQGAVIGVAQSAGSLARIGGPIFAATLFDHHPALPYLACGVVAFVAGTLAWQLLYKRTEPATSASLTSATGA